ncbi:MAG: flavin reductase family protein [Actinobacteria bacterium]|nr:flavin reductase family protein [Actinomycetota bacterium]
MSPVPQLAAGVIDANLMRRAMGRFLTGVAVVTALAADGSPHGMTLNSLTSVCLDRPILLICISLEARTTQAIDETGTFAVSILTPRQEPIARRFALPGEDHFAGLPLVYCNHEVPVVPQAIAHLGCSVERCVTAGDHAVVFGTPRTVGDSDRAPLGFLGGRFGDYVDRGHEPIQWFF